MSAEFLPDLHISEIKLLVDQLCFSGIHDKIECFNELSYHMIGYTLEYFLNYGKLPRPPYSPLEYTELYDETAEILKKLIRYTGHPNEVRNVIQNLSPDQILKLQGMRITEGSQFDAITFPDPILLIELANKKYNEFLTDLARARAKHSLRCENEYWGKISGSPLDQNEQSNNLLLQFLKKFTWWNYFEHFKHGLVFELRDPTGHGMRWSISNSAFLGLIEPIDPNQGRVFWENVEDFNRRPPH